LARSLDEAEFWTLLIGPARIQGMKHVSTLEAEKQLSTLVAEVEKGREIVITRDGATVAKLVQTKASSRGPIRRKRSHGAATRLKNFGKLAEASIFGYLGKRSKRGSQRDNIDRP
jgi:antitoxin (DNA-binding transcriptional repressor) of toxin-antitoxin stability system